jgi:hypothetical protein
VVHLVHMLWALMTKMKKKPDHVEPNKGLHRQIVTCRQMTEQTMTKVN